jgi:hypothetical protein
LVVIAALIGAAGFPLVRASNLMGDSSQHLVLSFDRGQFIQNVALGMAPIWILSATSLVSGRLSFATLLVWACVLVPTFVDFAGHGAVSSTMSMKMASLLAVASVPSIADGLVRLLAPRRLAAPAANVDVIAPGAPASTSGSSKIWRAAAGLALIAGLANSLVYTLQFAVYRLTDHAGPRTVDLSADYVGALDFVRRNSPRDAVVVDPDGDRLLDTIGTVLIAERLVWLPTRYSAVLVRSDRDYPAIMARPAIWRAWESSQFTDEALAAQIAGQADILVAPPNIESAHWQRRKVAGTFAVYSSRDRPSP